jgi:ferritin
MIRENIQEAINKQINTELFSAYLYQSMGAYLDSENLGGMSAWMNMQAEEEVEHAMKFYNYLLKRGGRVKLYAIDEPQFEWNSPLEVFEASYEHEQYVTGRINDLVDLAAKEKDHATGVMLQWFVSEQVEEEATVDEIVDKIKMVSESRNGLYMLDRELGKRDS